MLRGHLTGTRLGIGLAVVAGVLLGAIVGRPGAGTAATTAVPKNKTPPTITGTAVVGQLLVATHGTWSGTPTKFAYQWSQCDATGAGCLSVTGATGKSYRVRAGDAGHTLRVTVTARNASGAANATSAQTAVVPPSGCPTGTGAIQIAQLVSPARLDITSWSVTPGVKRSTKSIQLHFTVTACNGRPVAGANVFATAVPYNQFAVGQGTTAADGTVVLAEARRAGFPASRRQRLLAVFVRAWKQGEPATGGVSTSRLVAFHFAHH